MQNMADTVIRSRIDATLKLEAQTLLHKLGLSMSDAIRLFIHQVVAEKGLPFQIKLPERAAREHDAWFRQQVHAAIEDADNPATVFIPHEQVQKEWAAKRKELTKQSRKRNQS
jgi:addiction module RelB/DinJ family antitoxin